MNAGIPLFQLLKKDEMRKALKFTGAAAAICALAFGASAQTMEDQIGAVNAELAGTGSEVRIGAVEYIR